MGGFRDWARIGLVLASVAITWSSAFDRGDVEMELSDMEKLRLRYILNPSLAKFTRTKTCVEGDFEANENDCNSYFMCVHGNKLALKCEEGLHWDQKQRICNFPKEAGCAKELGGDETVVFEEDDSSLHIKSSASCVTGEYEASPTSCNEFYQCDNGKKVMKKCQFGLHWDQTGKICNHAESAGCTLQEGEVGGDGTDNDVDSVLVPAQPAPTQPPPAPATEAPAVVVVPAEEPTVPVIQQVEETGMKVVCYFTNWAWYRPGLGKFVPEDIDPKLCTHINYGFVVLDKNNLLIKVHDSWADVDNKFFTRVSDMKKKGSKVLLALGGWNDSLGDHYHRLVKSAANRRKFIEHALQFVQKYDYDGLDLDWEYPVCWQTKCRDDAKTDKQDFLSLVIELKALFKQHGLLVTAALSPNPKIIDLAYDLPELNKHLDLFNVMTYDYYGAWDKKAGHHSPLYHHPNHSHPEFSADTTMKHYAAGGVDKSKLVMGMPTYGRMFTLKDATKNDVGADGTAGKPGKFTRSGGFDSYYEICQFIKEGYKVVRDPEDRIGPYAFKGNQWVGYDDVKSIRQKSEYIKREGYGGGMIWALDLDDFNGCFCGEGKYPLLSEINRVLRGLTGSNEPKGTCVYKHPWEQYQLLQPAAASDSSQLAKLTMPVYHQQQPIRTLYSAVPSLVPVSPYSPWTPVNYYTLG